MALPAPDNTRARLRREICDVVNAIGSVDNCNVLATIDKPETCTSPPELQQRLRDALAVWFSLDAAAGLGTHSLVYDFGDYKSGQALALSALSPGGETTQFHCLRSVAEELNCEVFLIKLKRKDTGVEDLGYDESTMCEEPEYDEDDEDEDESQPSPGVTYDITERIWTAEVLVDWRSGFKLDEYPLEEDVIVQDEFDMDAYDDDVDEELEDVWEGDYQNTVRGFSRWFTSTAALIIPKASLLEFFCELSLHDDRSSSVSQLVCYMAAKCSDLGNGQRYIHDLFELCTNLSISPNQLRALNEGTITEVLQLAIRYNHAQVFDLISSNIAITVSPKFFTWAGVHLRNVRWPLGALILAMRRALSVSRRCGDWYACIVSLKTSETETPDELREFAQVALSQAALLCSEGEVYEGDGETLVFIACLFKNFTWLSNEVAPIVRRRAADFAFSAIFCCSLYNAAIRKELPQEESLELLRGLVATIRESFDILQLVSVPVYCQRTQQAVTTKGMPLPPPPVSSDTLIHLIRLVVAINSEDDVQSFLSKIEEQVGLVDCRDLTSLYIPFVDDLLALAEAQSADLRSSIYASLAREIVMEYWQQQYVGSGLPPQPQAQALVQLSMLLLNCGCPFCRGIHRFFFESPHAPQAVFGGEVSDRAGLIHLSAAVKQCTGVCDYHVEHQGKYCKWMLTKRGYLPPEGQSSRVQSARAALSKANQPRLSLALGEQLYGQLMGVSPPSLAPKEGANSLHPIHIE
ncbi:hypothetical protein PG997_003843 [Apiospora hydei]|uniref:Uncharacterized protein n=1 Tax=Apiospora hydei TaxID=1337664 RepID=A0ABR1X0C9_9PEZI